MFPFVRHVNLAGWAHIVVYGVVLPLLVVKARAKMTAAADAAAPLPDRLRHFQSTVIELTLFGAGSVAVARAQWMQLFPRAWPPVRGLVAGAAAYAIAVLYMQPRWRRAVEKRSRVAYLFMPSTGAERAWWVTISVLAGVTEEITWRGVQTGLLAAATGSYALAAVLSAVSFGGAHATQGLRSSAVVVVFAFGFQAIVWLSGSLYVAMAVHVAYDLTAGITYGRLGRELGYV